MKDSWFHPDRIGTYKGEMKDGLAHGKGTYTSSHKGKKGFSISFLIKMIFIKEAILGKRTH